MDDTRTYFRDTRTGATISCRTPADADALVAEYRVAGNAAALILVSPPRPSQEPASVAQGGASPEPYDEDFKRLFGDGWEEAKANHDRIAALPFPEGYDFSEILEPIGGSQESTTPPDDERSFERDEESRDELVNRLLDDNERLVAENTRLASERTMSLGLQADYVKEISSLRSTVTRLEKERNNWQTASDEACEVINDLRATVTRQSEVIEAIRPAAQAFRREYHSSRCLCGLCVALASLTPPTPPKND